MNMKGLLIATLFLVIIPSSLQSTTWSVKDANGTVCVVATMGINIEISYLDNNGGRINSTIELPKTFDRMGGYCQDENSPNSNLLTLEWDKDNATFKFNLKFNKISEDGGTTYTRYELKEVSMSIPMMANLFPNVESAVLNQTLVVSNMNVEGEEPQQLGYSTKLSRCMVCNTENALVALEAHGDDEAHYHDTLVTMTISDVQFIAFKEDASTHLSDSGDCNKCQTDIASPPEDRFFVTGADGEVCVVLDIAAKMIIPYKMYDNTNGHGIFNLPSQNETTVSGQCDENKQTVTVTFFEGWTLSATFEKEHVDSSGHYNFSDLSLTYTYSAQRFVDPHDSIVDTSATVSLSMGNQTNLDPFQVAMGQYFKCQREQTLLMGDSTGNGAKLNTFKLDFQAFKQTNDKAFSNADNFYECYSGSNNGGGGSGSSSGSNAVVHVAIAVTVGLVAVLLLVIFLIKQQRARASYESM